jgi:hypothetical protein
MRILKKLMERYRLNSSGSVEGPSEQSNECSGLYKMAV